MEIYAQNWIKIIEVFKDLREDPPKCAAASWTEQEYSIFSDLVEAIVYIISIEPYVLKIEIINFNRLMFKE